MRLRADRRTLTSRAFRGRPCRCRRFPCRRFPSTVLDETLPGTFVVSVELASTVETPDDVEHDAVIATRIRTATLETRRTKRRYPPTSASTGQGRHRTGPKVRSDQTGYVSMSVAFTWRVRLRLAGARAPRRRSRGTASRRTSGPSRRPHVVNGRRKSAFAIKRSSRVGLLAHAAGQRVHESGGTTEQGADRRVGERGRAGIDERLEIGQATGC